jgi:hypothetical protein
VAHSPPRPRFARAGPILIGGDMIDIIELDKAISDSSVNFAEDFLDAI